MKVKELWYYNVDRVNYRPAFHERIADQMSRKQKLMRRPIPLDQQNSIYTQATETARESNPAEQQLATTVIGSALKIRDVDDLRLKHLRRCNYETKVPHTTKNVHTMEIK